MTPKKIKTGERFEPFLDHDVLLSAHREYQTTANGEYLGLSPTRTKDRNY